MADNTPCVNTILIDKHLNSIDAEDASFNYAYDKLIALFRDDLENVFCREDIDSDLTFEAQCLVEDEELGINYLDVVEQIYSDYDLD